MVHDLCLYNSLRECWFKSQGHRPSSLMNIHDSCHIQWLNSMLAVGFTTLASYQLLQYCRKKMKRWTAFSWHKHFELSQQLFIQWYSKRSTHLPRGRPKVAIEMVIVVVSNIHETDVPSNIICTEAPCSIVVNGCRFYWCLCQIDTSVCNIHESIINRVPPDTI